MIVALGRVDMMQKMSGGLVRPMVALAVAVMVSGPLAMPAQAGILDVASPLNDALGNASDKALDKLSQPGAFYADEAVRILLPGMGGKTVSKLMKFSKKLGVSDKLTKSINDAAGLAAKEAKPIFRKAADDFTIADAPKLVLKGDGATQYFRKSAGDTLRGKVRPLVQSSLGKLGAFQQLGKLGKAGSLLGKAGLSQDGLTDSVTDQTMDGIFKYMANEEASIRSNPLQAGKSILDGLIK
jgi:hypothetical protein